MTYVSDAQSNQIVATKAQYWNVVLAAYEERLLNRGRALYTEILSSLNCWRKIFKHEPSFILHNF